MSNGKRTEVMSLIEHDDDFSQWCDPLTQLPLQHVVRDWSIEKLRSGHEICIIFFDIDDFALFNRLYGHMSGDRLLEKVGRIIAEELDSHLSIACRRGGDEFVVATLHTPDEAQQLAVRIARKVEEIWLHGVRKKVSVSYSVSVGRRSDEREDLHYAATVDNPLLRASRLCMQHTPP